jgi:hypothetical protein
LFSTNSFFFFFFLIQPLFYSRPSKFHDQTTQNHFSPFLPLNFWFPSPNIFLFLFYFVFWYFWKGHINIDLVRKINQWFWNIRIKNRTSQKYFFLWNFNSFEKTLKKPKMMKLHQNIFFGFF